MHYKKLLEANRAFYQEEHRAKNYDRYMLDQKNWKNWDSPILSVAEAEKLLKFIRSWDRFFQGDNAVFRKIYAEIYPILGKLKEEKIEDAHLDNRELQIIVRDVFDKTANCTLIDRYESTDASKMLHTIIPDFFVMWDDEIKNWTVQGRHRGATYAFYFLPKMQQELEEAISTCMAEMKLARAQAIQYIRLETGGKTLAKLADEYNYMKYTMGHSSL